MESGERLMPQKSGKQTANNSANLNVNEVQFEQNVVKVSSALSPEQAIIQEEKRRKKSSSKGRTDPADMTSVALTEEEERQQALPDDIDVDL
jgi:hypothetical protein